MMDWLEEAEAEEALVSPKEIKALKQRDLKRLEDEVFEEAAWVCQQSMRYGDIPIGTEEPPPEWIEEHGQAQAERMLRYIQAGQMPIKDAPGGVKIAAMVLVGLLRARDDRSNAPQVNIQLVTLTQGETITYPSQAVDE